MKYNFKRYPRFAALQGELNSFQAREVKVNLNIARMIMSAMDTHLTRDGRIEFFCDVFERVITTSAQLKITEIYGLTKWASPRKIGNVWSYNSLYISDLKGLANVANIRKIVDEVKQAEESA